MLWFSLNNRQGIKMSAKSRKKADSEGPEAANPGYHMRLVRPAAENKKIFASNLDWLLRVTGLSRKQASKAIGVDYQVLRRLVTAGVSRPDKRNEEVLDRIRKYFQLNSTAELWLESLGQTLLSEEDTGARFVKKFRDRLVQHFSNASAFTLTEGEWLTESLGQPKKETTKQDKSQRALMRKVEFILSSSIGSRFEAVVRDYYTLAQFKQTG